MSVSVRQLDSQCKMADYLTLPQLETILPAHVIQEVLTACEAWEQREKKLNMQAMIYLIIALALYPQCSTREVYRRLLEGLHDGLSLQDEVPTAGALCQRRQQLAVTPLRALFARIARPLALPLLWSSQGGPVAATDQGRRTDALRYAYQGRMDRGRSGADAHHGHSALTTWDQERGTQMLSRRLPR
jgi:Insertion element 4 transposase N-terminal